MKKIDYRTLSELAFDCSTIAGVASRLVDQTDEPFPGSDGDRLHYWRSKAIDGAKALREIGLSPLEPPPNGEQDPAWLAIRRTVDLFVGRLPGIGKHKAANGAHIALMVEQLDGIGQRDASDTIVWLCWHRALDRERERLLLTGLLSPRRQPIDPDYAGPVVSFDVAKPYYLASCDSCGWVGSSEHCGRDTGGDDSDVYCPRCNAAGADCGKVANRAPTQDAYDRACRALNWRTEQLRANGIKPYPIQPNAPQSPPEGHSFIAAPAGDGETVEFVREWLMSGDHPVSDWERQFAAAIDVRPRAAVGERDKLRDIVALAVMPECEDEWTAVDNCVDAILLQSLPAKVGDA